MDEYLDRLDALFSEFVARISHFEPIADFPLRFRTLDRELVAQVAALRRQYAACRRIEALRQEGATLDRQVNTILLELTQFRKELERAPSAPVTSAYAPVNSQDLLEYASKITRFTKQLPGSAEVGILPWPAEDQLRRGMLATLMLQEEAMSSQEPEHAQVAASPAPARHAPPDQPDARDQPPAPPAGTQPGSAAPRAQPQPKSKPKISLDLDSDEDD